MDKYEELFKEYIDMMVEMFEVGTLDCCECDSSPYIYVYNGNRDTFFEGFFDKDEKPEVIDLCLKYGVLPHVVYAADRYASQKLGIPRKFGNLTFYDGSTLDGIIERAKQRYDNNILKLGKFLESKKEVK